MCVCVCVCVCECVCVCGQALWTTEGHLFLMKAGALDVYPTFAHASPQYKPRRRKAHNITGLLPLTQDSCTLPVPGWREAFNAALVAPRNATVALSEDDVTCPVLPDVHQDEWDVSSLHSAEVYFKVARDSVVAKTAAATAQQRQRGVMASELIATYNRLTKRFDVSPWNYVSQRAPCGGAVIIVECSHRLCACVRVCACVQGGVFSEAALAKELNDADVLPAYVSARVSAVTISCSDSQCTASLSLVGPSTLTLTVTTGTGAHWNFTACDAHFGSGVRVEEGVSGIIGVATPLSACGPVSLQTYRVSPEAEANDRVIAVVGRGGCSFVEKTRNAQRAGAVGVVVVDFQHVFPADVNGMQPTVFTLGDDNTGGDVTVFATGLAALSQPSASFDGRMMPFLCAVGMRRMDCSGGECGCQYVLPAAREAMQADTHSIGVDPVTVRVTSVANADDDSYTQGSPDRTDRAIAATNLVLSRVLKNH